MSRTSSSRICRIAIETFLPGEDHAVFSDARKKRRAAGQDTPGSREARLARKHRDLGAAREPVKQYDYSTARPSALSSQPADRLFRPARTAVSNTFRGEAGRMPVPYRKEHRHTCGVTIPVTDGRAHTSVPNPPSAAAVSRRAAAPLADSIAVSP